jgi:hypothetical protein
MATGTANIWYLNGGTVTGLVWLPSVPDMNWQIQAAGESYTYGALGALTKPGFGAVIAVEKVGGSGNSHVASEAVTDAGSLPAGSTDVSQTALGATIPQGSTVARRGHKPAPKYATTWSDGFVDSLTWSNLEVL